MSRAKVVVLGSNFGGLTAALAIKRELHGDVDVTVVSPSDRFLFTPSLIWLPFGKRTADTITFPVEPTLAAHGIDFVGAAAFHVDPVEKVVDTGPARLSYDHLVIATGYRTTSTPCRDSAGTRTRSPRWRTRSTPARRGGSVKPGAVRLTDGRTIPFRYAMIVPPFMGQDVVHKVDGLADGNGFVPVRPTYQSEKYDDVYAVGVAAAVEVPWQTAVPVGVPKTGFPTEQQAHVAARNIAAQVRGDIPSEQKEFADIPAVCVMDAGNNGNRG